MLCWQKSHWQYSANGLERSGTLPNSQIALLWSPYFFPWRLVLQNEHLHLHDVGQSTTFWLSVQMPCFPEMLRLGDENTYSFFNGRSVCFQLRSVQCKRFVAHNEHQPLSQGMTHELSCGMLLPCGQKWYCCEEWPWTNQMNLSRITPAGKRYGAPDMTWGKIKI